MKNFQQDNFIQKNNLVPVANQLRQFWLNKLSEYPQTSDTTREIIINWLLGNNTERFETLTPIDLQIATTAMDYRWRILHQRYLGVSQEQAYHNLITRLGVSATLQSKIKIWISSSRDRKRKTLDVLSELLHELLQRDKYIQQQMSFIATLTRDIRLKNALLFATTEEYSLRRIHNQPLIAHRFVNYMRSIERNGLTQVPSSNQVRFVSSDIDTTENNNCFSLFDNTAIAKYQEQSEQEIQTFLRLEVQEKFAEYLKANLGEDAVKWFQLYLQGKTALEIAKILNKPVTKIYRLRETVKYHAVLVFMSREKPELVQGWLETL